MCDRLIAKSMSRRSAILGLVVIATISVRQSVYAQGELDDLRKQVHQLESEIQELESRKKPLLQILAVLPDADASRRKKIDELRNLVEEIKDKIDSLEKLKDAIAAKEKELLNSAAGWVEIRQLKRTNESNSQCRQRLYTTYYVLGDSYSGTPEQDNELLAAMKKDWAELEEFSRQNRELLRLLDEEDTGEDEVPPFTLRLREKKHEIAFCAEGEAKLILGFTGADCAVYNMSQKTGRYEVAICGSAAVGVGAEATTPIGQAGIGAKYEALYCFTYEYEIVPYDGKLDFWEFLRIVTGPGGTRSTSETTLCTDMKSCILNDQQMMNDLGISEDGLKQFNSMRFGKVYRWEKKHWERFREKLDRGGLNKIRINVKL